MAKKINTNTKPPKDYSLIKAIRESNLYKENITRRDASVRKWANKDLPKKGQSTIMPGQMIMFNYFEPLTKEELEYYDAMPCTIFFSEFKNKEGFLRVLGFNIHYYPPRIRYQVVDRIFSIFKPLYEESWNDPLNRGMTFIQYKMLMQQLEKVGLSFGVREYDPKLMHSITPIPPKDWQKAVFTEGRFKKRTREQILNYWRQKFSQESFKKEPKQKKDL